MIEVVCSDYGMIALDRTPVCASFLKAAFCFYQSLKIALRIVLELFGVSSSVSSGRLCYFSPALSS